MSSQRPEFSPRSTDKTNNKSTISRRMASIGISDVVTASVYSEKTRLKKLMMMMKMIIIIITENHLLVNEKRRYVGMTKCFSKEYRNKE